MVEYFILMLLISLICFVFRYCRKNKRNKTIFLLIITLVLTMFAGIRDVSVGADTAGYLRIFELHSERDSTYFQSLELGFQWLVKGINYITDSAIVYFIILAAIPIGLTLKFIDKWSDDIYLSVFCYMSLGCYFLLFNTSRQCIAIAITFISFEYAIHKKWILSLVYTGIAVLFHASSAVFFLCVALMFIQDKKSRNRIGGYILSKSQKKVMLYFIITLLIGMLFLNEIINWLLEYFPRYQSLYIDQIERNEQYFTGGNIYILFINFAIWFALVFLTPATNKAKEKFLIPISLALFFSVMQYRLVVMARFVWYFDIYNIFVIPGIVKENIFSKGSKNIVLYIILALCVLLYIYYVLHNYQAIVPYEIFNG